MMHKKGIIITPADLIGTDWLARMKRLKLNTLGMHTGNGRAKDILPALGETASPAFRKPYEDAGIQVEYEVHAPATLMPPDLFASHPDYFAMDENGNRQSGGNWCISNPETAAVLTERARELSLALPSSTHRYYYWGADKRNAVCRCPECRKHSFADLYLRSINAIAAGVQQADPAGKTAYLAYLDIYDVPQQTAPADGVFLEFAPFIRSFTEPLADPDSEVNRPFCKAFRELTQFFDVRETLILEYFLDSSLFSHYRKPAIRPAVAPGVLEKDLEFYANAGVAGLTTFAVYMDGNYFSRYGEEELEAYAEKINLYF